jgi:hypothetical protein
MGVPKNVVENAQRIKPKVEKQMQGVLLLDFFPQVLVGGGTQMLARKCRCPPHTPYKAFSHILCFYV